MRRARLQALAEPGTEAEPIIFTTAAVDVDGNDIQPVTIERNRKTASVEVTPQVKVARDGGRLEPGPGPAGHTG